jgi:hypothetical protein
MSGNICTFLNWNNFFWCHDVMNSIRSIESLFNCFWSRKFCRLLNLGLYKVLYSFVKKLTLWLSCWLWFNSGVWSYFFDSSSVTWRFNFSYWTFHVISFNFIIICWFVFNWNLTFYFLYFIWYVINYSMSFYVVIFFNWSHFIVYFFDKTSLSGVNWDYFLFGGLN